MHKSNQTKQIEASWQQRAISEINNKTKPHGALGELEDLAVQLAVIQKTLTPAIYPACVLVFGADHGVARQGVSAYPTEVTAQMMANFAAGGAAINAICNSVKAELKVIDMGVNADLTAFNNIAHEKVNSGTNDISVTTAMTVAEYNQALETGKKYAKIAYKEGFKTLALGEMGIGNTTSAAAVICALTKLQSKDIVGRGTGIDDQAMINKRSIVDTALSLHLNKSNDPECILQALGGFEIVAIAGAILMAAELNLITIVDGFISTAAALGACAINPDIGDRLIYSHQSAETGHKLTLSHLQAKPLLKLGLRLGEGTGAALCIPIIDATAKVLSEMATFEQAGVAAKS